MRFSCLFNSNSARCRKRAPATPCRPSLGITDLVAAKIVGNWTTLLRLIETEGFPEGIMIGPNARAWRLDDVEEWLASRPTARKTMPDGCVPLRGRRAEEREATG